MKSRKDNILKSESVNKLGLYINKTNNYLQRINSNLIFFLQFNIGLVFLQLKLMIGTRPNNVIGLSLIIILPFHDKTD